MTQNETPAAPRASITLGQYAQFLTHYLRPRLKLVLLLGLTLFTSIGLQLVNPQVLRSFIDTARAGGARELLTRTALTFIGIAVAQQLVGVLVVYITENLGWATTNALRLELAAHCLGLDMSFHAAHTPGEMIERIDGDVMALSNFFSQFILQVFGNMLLVSGILVVLVGVDWRVSLSLALFVAITVAVLLRLANISVASWEAERQSSAGLFGFLEERLSGTEDIRSNNAGAYVLDRFYRLTRDLMRKTIRAVLKINVLLNTTWVLFAVGNAVALLVSASLFRSNAITLGTVYMIMYYTNMLNWPLERITQQMQDLQKAGASLMRVMSIRAISGRIAGENEFSAAHLPALGVEQTIPEPGPRARSGAGARLAPGPLAVVFDGVTFSYKDSFGARPTSGLQAVSAIVQTAAADDMPGAMPGAAAEATLDAGGARPVAADADIGAGIVLQDLTFRVAPGRVLGLLGRTGSGKTTLTRLLFRLYDPDAGSISLGDELCPVDIRQLTVQELRSRVGMVTQNIQLFHATVRENLTFFDPSIPDTRILESIRDLGLWDWYLSLPKGLDTELESAGGGLSAGEAQMLAFTRIFLRDPGLVVLDEATSRLDPATEHLIERAVDKLVCNRTAIIVAHRLGTVQRADDILILEDGMTCEYGPRSALAQEPGSRFARLLQTGLEEVLA